MKVMSTVATHCAMGKDPSPLSELALVLVHLDHVAPLHRKRESRHHVERLKNLVKLYQWLPVVPVLPVPPVVGLDSPVTPPPPLTSFTGFRSRTLMSSLFLRMRHADKITSML
jgi:hypothetical protein